MDYHFCLAILKKCLWHGKVGLLKTFFLIIWCCLRNWVMYAGCITVIMRQDFRLSNFRIACRWSKLFHSAWHFYLVVLVDQIPCLSLEHFGFVFFVLLLFMNCYHLGFLILSFVLCTCLNGYSERVMFCSCTVLRIEEIDVLHWGLNSLHHWQD